MPTRVQRSQPCPYLAWGRGPPAQQGHFTKDVLRPLLGGGGGLASCGLRGTPVRARPQLCPLRLCQGSVRASGPQGGLSRACWGRQGVLFHVHAPGPSPCLPGSPAPPPGPGQVSICPIDGQAHAEPLVDLLTQAACPIPSFLVNSGHSGTMLSSAPQGARQDDGPAATLASPPPSLQGPAGGPPRLPGAFTRPHSQDSCTTVGTATSHF